MSELISERYIELNKELHKKDVFGGIENNSGLTVNFPSALLKMHKLLTPLHTLLWK